MKLHRAAAIASLSLVALTATACVDDDEGGAAEGPLPPVCQGQDGEGRSVGFGNLGESVPFAVLVREGIEKVADECNLEILNADNELDPQRALENARTFVTQGAEGVIEFQVDSGIAEAICDIVEDRPIIAIDIPHEPCAVFMGADNRGAGEMTGQGAGNLAKELWNCDIDAIVTFEGFASGEPSIDRLNGSIAGVEQVCPDLEYGNYDDWGETVPDSIITRIDADRTEPAFSQGRDWLTANPDADHIVALCLNEDSCLGFHSAVEQAGRSGQVIFASNGADPSGHDLIRNDEFYAGATAFFPEKYGELVVPNIIRMLNGEEPEADPLLMDHVFITAQNINEYYPADGSGS
jgi:ribose transport system substrate-binding protein